MNLEKENIKFFFGNTKTHYNGKREKFHQINILTLDQKIYSKWFKFIIGHAYEHKILDKLKM